ncbi:DUF4199 domain-containing protein [Flavobacterium okayamense]|uniref:DUF4199 domain-containing protein n=1 Tax=Flavobacterium okayamense TaxID=2830782 RepID=A0ABM7SAC6_9FLAO|nr:DUF4199 domain-containing protein [Flavobacterium okayamense]BCY29653.1 hypothetical protein KK2020170_25210 [Flavobacterium okayamense]
MNEIVKKNSVKYGIIAGVFALLLTSTMYAVNLELFAKWWIGVTNIIIYTALGIFAMVQTKKELNGVYTFKDAFTTYFVYAVIGIAISIAFNIILFNFIDPGAKETLKEISIEAAVSMMKKFGAPSDAIKKAVEDMSNSDQFGIVEQLKGSVFSIIFSAIFAAILAAIFKSKPKEQF